MPDRPDVDDLIRALQAPEPPLEPPAIPQRRSWFLPVGLFGGLCAAAAGVLLFARPPTPGMVERGTGGVAPPPGVDLQLASEVDGAAVRLDPSRTLAVGRAVFFRVSADRTAEVRIWVDGPAGREDVATIQAEPEARDVTTSGGFVAWTADQPGAYAFHASSDPEGGCAPASCASVTVVVEPSGM